MKRQLVAVVGLLLARGSICGKTNLTISICNGTSGMGAFTPWVKVNGTKL